MARGAYYVFYVARRPPSAGRFFNRGRWDPSFFFFVRPSYTRSVRRRVRTNRVGKNTSGNKYAPNVTTSLTLSRGTILAWPSFVFRSRRSRGGEPVGDGYGRYRGRFVYRPGAVRNMAAGARANARLRGYQLTGRRATTVYRGKHSRRTAERRDATSPRGSPLSVPRCCQ